ncbi:MAG: SH3 domain-containing protein [Aestuariivita sp.]|nr:SH3 domain-containing protein [Aestuariivita sp.]MCY4347004.1 SH3 domain-containing protein [Aestuariivita sp.]
MILRPFNLLIAVAIVWLPTEFVYSGEPVKGTVTNLPIPRYVSMKAVRGNARRGPSLSHRIDWVYKHQNLPLKITAEHGHWRQVQDRDGQGGWIHYALLSGVRTVIVESERLQAYTRPDPTTAIVAIFEQGVIAELYECSLDWCSISAEGYRGWALKTDLWGVNADEIRE